MPTAEAIQRQRVTITDNVILDFTGLFSQEEAPESPVEPLLGAGAINNPIEPQKPVQGQINGLEREQAKQLFLQATREQEDHRRSLEVYRTYQENIKTSSPLQIELEEVQGQLQKLIEADKREKDSDSKERIQRAIQAHKNKATELREMIEKTQL